MMTLEHRFGIVYVVTSRGRDAYSVMTRLSAAGARRTNPTARIVIVCDPSTAAALEAAGDPLLEEIDELAVHETPDGSATFRNRHLKTRLRLLREGPLVFLDSDTFVRGDLSAWFGGEWDVRAARNHNRPAAMDQISRGDREIQTAMKWDMTAGPYVNGGVLFYHDTPQSRSFAQHWHALWLKSADASGRLQDQPSLNRALRQSGARLRLLPNRLNAQVKTRFEFDCERHTREGGDRVDRDAVVWHYYASVNENPVTLFEEEVARLLAGGELQQDAVQRMIKADDPWIHRDGLDELMIRCFDRLPRLGQPCRLWLEGARLRAGLRMARLRLARARTHLPKRPSRWQRAGGGALTGSFFW